MGDRIRVDLSGAPQTMLATLYAKALDADLPKPILGDRFAKKNCGKGIVQLAEECPSSRHVRAWVICHTRLCPIEKPERFG